MVAPPRPPPRPLPSRPFRKGSYAPMASLIVWLALALVVVAVMR